MAHRSLRRGKVVFEKDMRRLQFQQRTPDAHRRAEKFFDYGAADAWRQRSMLLRRDWVEDAAEQSSADKLRA